MCRASGAVFYLDTKVRGAVFYSDTRAPGAVFYSDRSPIRGGESRVSRVNARCFIPS